ncbi:MAG TPA: PTS transporter subunit IIBC, partial [Caldisericia bacterium]|nr:PTS transporter subunit IIBC [Caldisericia bacterium]
LEAPALNMGVFVGIIAGFIGAMAYNKYYNYRKLPDALSFFNGKRFVPFVVILWSTIVALILAIVWPNVQAGINNFGLWIAESKENAPILAPFLYGTLERLLLPFGLHHMLTIPINYTQLGGTYEILSGAQAGTQVFGQDPLWLAWVTDLVNLKGAGDMSQYEFVLTNWTPARFKVGQMIGSSGILMGLALAMYRNVDPDKKSKYKSMYFSAALAVFLTGVTEPLEFMFMFAAVPLYIVYSVIQGAAFAMADILPLRVHSFGNIELLTRTPLAIKAGLGIDLLNFVICVILFGVLTYFVANFLIKKFNYATPGRNGNYDNDSEETPSGSATNADQQIIKIIHLLGGKENIKDVDACMTRLRVSIEDPGKVGSEEEWKRAGAMGLIVKDKGVQAVYGPKADVLKSDIEDLLQSGADIPEPTVEATNKNEKNEEKHVLGIEKELFTVATGEVIALTDVNDPVFSQKMMGDGFAVIPATGEVTAPLSGKIVSVFPTKHAIGMQTAEGAEVLIHMGLDTVQMSQPAFEILVSEGQEVVAGTTIAQMNLDAIKNEGKETTIIVVFTDDKVNGLTINKLGDTERGTVIGKINL